MRASPPEKHHSRFTHTRLALRPLFLDFRPIFFNLETRFHIVTHLFSFKTNFCALEAHLFGLEIYFSHCDSFIWQRNYIFLLEDFFFLSFSSRSCLGLRGLMVCVWLPCWALGVAPVPSGGCSSAETAAGPVSLVDSAACASAAPRGNAETQGRTSDSA